MALLLGYLSSALLCSRALCSLRGLSMACAWAVKTDRSAPCILAPARSCGCWQNADPQSAWGPRIYTFFFYLSDVEEGGGTFFPNLNITVEPRVGRALIWPSVYDSNILRSDMRTEHEALPVVRGEKYASNLWLHLREFQKPLLNGCENRAVKRRIT